ncbi:MAG: CHAT domain-containing protein [Cyanobacteria bacterium P01_F01_bin.150]
MLKLLFQFIRQLWGQKWRWRGPYGNATRLSQRYIWLTLLAILLCVVGMPALNAGISRAIAPSSTVASTVAQTPEQQEQQAQTKYESGQYREAEALLQRSRQAYDIAGDWVGEAVTLSNLSLTYQQLGEWSNASCRVTQAIALLTDDNPAYGAAYVGELQRLDADTCPIKTVANKQTDNSYGSVLAQSLDVRGQLELSLGKLEQAVDTWDKAIALYQQDNNQNRAALSRIHQAQALQSLGLYPLTIERLSSLKDSLSDSPNSFAKVSTLQRLGDAQRGIGRLNEAKAAIKESLDLSQQLLASSPDAASASSNQAIADALASAYLGLGNVIRADINTSLDQPLSHLADYGNGYGTFQPKANIKEQCLGNRAVVTSEEMLDAGRKLVQAIACYQTAAQVPNITPTTKINAQLNHLSLLTETQQWQPAMELQQDIQRHIDALPPGRSAVYAQVNLAQSLVQLKQANRPGLSWDAITQRLTNAHNQATELGDSRAKSFALGYLGHVYELTNHPNYADQVTRDALSLAQASRAFDISYQWQWQLGRVLRTDTNKRDEAIAAYSTAFETLKLLRADLVATTPDVKFSFRKSVEPVYRELVDLLLDPNTGKETSQADLAQARDVMEALQVAQLENFFQSACLDPKLKLDQVIQARQQKAAVIYPIILPDRLEVIVKLPNRERLVHYAPHFIPQKNMEQFLQTFRRDLQAPYTHLVVKQEGQRLYNWLIQPGQTAMEDQEVNTLIFVLDGPLRKVPMAALYDGQQYLAETKAIDVVLGLEITDPEPLVRDRINVLAAGLVEPPDVDGLAQRYAVLKQVEAELETIQSSGVDNTIIKNNSFTRERFNQTLNEKSYNVVHLATHGQFGADRQQTFLLDAKGKITLDELSSLFGTTTTADPIELLILSACRTATGNDRDVLGIAGTTVRAGAQSAIASLWSLDDESSEIFTKAFYENFGKPNISRAEALRLAQKALMDDPTFNHPRYWAPYVLVGNWL